MLSFLSFENDISFSIQIKIAEDFVAGYTSEVQLDQCI